MKIASRLLATATLAGFVLSLSPANAATPGVTLSDEAYFNGDGPWTLGYTFTATQNVTVTALGAYDYLGDGFIDSHEVGLWDSSGTLLSSTAVSSADTLIDGFRYANIASLNLVAGNTYTVGASDFGVNDAYVLQATVANATGITYDSAQYLPTSGLAYPSTLGTPGGYFGGNFLLSGVPEPTSWAMMVLGFGLVGAAMRRRATVAPSRVSYSF